MATTSSKQPSPRMQARNDDVALSAFVRDQWGSGSFGNASENPNPPAVIEEHGHRCRLQGGLDGV